nr:retrotransposon protein, putative, Ty3-gypsy subclass [Tanacetum cinerariifolium]
NEFRLDEDDVLWQGTRLCVPNDATLREALLTEAHISLFSVHPGSTKMYHDLKQHFWWSGMKRDRRHDAIGVVVDRLTKSAHFLPIRKDYSISKLAETFQQEIVRLHGTPSAIVSDRDPRFTSRFWKGLQKAWGTRLKFSTAFHPQTDGQTERTIQTLKDMLRSCALKWTGNWDDYICLIEFAYNNRYKYHPLHVVSYPLDQIRADLSYIEEPEAILDHQDRVMRNKTIPFVKILWRNHPEREATWETEESIRTSYPHFLP